MLRALIYLRWVSGWNWTLSRIRRLRQPRYLGGAIVGGAYLYFVFRGFARPGGPAPGGRPPLAAMPAPEVAFTLDGAALAATVGSMLLLAIAGLMWIVPTRRAALGFSEAEVAFLFPAPVTRRNLVHFRLISSQLRSLIGATIMMLLSNRWTFLGGNAFTHAVGWWFVFSAVNLHYTGASFTLTRLADRGVGTWRRRALVLASAAAIVAATVARTPVALQLQGVREDLILQEFAGWVSAFAATAPLSWVLQPIQWLLAPFLAAHAQDFLIALGPALAVIVLHYLWVVQTAVSFEEATIEQAGQRAERVAAWRAGDRRIGRAPSRSHSTPFPLRPTGRPEVAFLWKNLLSTWPYFRLRVFLGCALALTAAFLWVNAHPEWGGLLPMAGAFALVLGGYTLVLGPQFARQDLRSDLPNTDILKTYPLAGWQVILGELLTPTAILTGVLWLALLVAALAFQPLGANAGWLTPSVRITAAAAIAVNIPALAALQLLVPNAATLLFPGWFQASRGRGGGVEVVGQRMIFLFAQLLAMIAALLPPALFAGVLVFAFQWLVGPIAALGIGAAAAFVLLIGELSLGLWWLGGRFERLDIASELRP